MMTPESQEISYFKDEADSNPQRAWSDFNGIFEGSKSTSGLMVLQQHQDNPDYPGDWVEYPTSGVGFLSGHSPLRGQDIHLTRQ